MRAEEYLHLLFGPGGGVGWPEFREQAPGIYQCEMRDGTRVRIRIYGETAWRGYDYVNARGDAINLPYSTYDLTLFQAEQLFRE